MNHLYIYPLFLLFAFSAFVNAQSTKTLDQLTNKDIVLLTDGYHDTWVDWSDDDRYIVFISPNSGSNNLYRIDLKDLELTQVNEGLYAASYLANEESKNPVEQITFEESRIVESPTYIPNTNKVAFMTYDCELEDGCDDFDLRLYDFETKETEIIIQDEFHIYDIIDENRMLYVPSEDESVLVEWDINTGESKVFKQFDFNIRGLQVHDDIILIDEGNRIHELDLSSKEMKLVYEDTIFGNRMEVINGSLIATFNGPFAGILDLNTQTPTPFFSTYDYQPSVSNDHTFVVAISENIGGILLKKFE